MMSDRGFKSKRGKKEKEGVFSFESQHWVKLKKEEEVVLLESTD